MPSDFTDCKPPPAPWAEGDKIPWNDAAFSERMLRERLSREHDADSRRIAKITRHVSLALALGVEPTPAL